jgi:ribosomal silencing factor RsfS
VANFFLRDGPDYLLILQTKLNYFMKFRSWCGLMMMAMVTHGQMRIEQMPLSPIKSNTGFLVYGADHLENGIPYSTINGTPFWQEKFLAATIYLKDEKSFGTCKVKINLATNDVHFLNSKGEEQIAQSGIIQKIIIHHEDSAGKISAVFRNNIEHINTRAEFANLYVEELNHGNWQLLKVSRKILQVSDSLFGTRKKYSFILKEAYFIKFSNRIQSLKKLSSKEIIPVLRLNTEQKKWISFNKINFAKEKDVLAVLNYMNAGRN